MNNDSQWSTQDAWAYYGQVRKSQKTTAKPMRAFVGCISRLQADVGDLPPHRLPPVECAAAVCGPRGDL